MHLFRYLDRLIIAGLTFVIFMTGCTQTTETTSESPAQHNGFASQSSQKMTPDPYLWLENIEGKQSLDWVNRHNNETARQLEQTPLFQTLYQDALSALNNPVKLPYIEQKGPWVYSFTRSAENPRGLYRRTLAQQVQAGQPVWETVLDIDTLSMQDGTNWVFKQMQCLPPAHIHCLVALSPGGGDEVILKEFNSSTLTFVNTGFNLPLAKMGVTWLDKNHIFVATDFGKNSMTQSGYARTVKLWTRGTPLSDARHIISVDRNSVGVSSRRFRSGKSTEQITVDIVSDHLSFWESKHYQWLNNQLVELQLPETAVIEGFYDGKILISLKQDWQYGDQLFLQGALVLADPEALHAPTLSGHGVSLVVTPHPKFVIEGVMVIEKGILINALEDVKSRLYLYQPKGISSKTTSVLNTHWQKTQIDLPQTGTITLETVNHEDDSFFVRYEDFLTPPTLYFVDKNLKSSAVLSQAATFDSSPFKVVQHFAHSKDGTEVPYFVVMKKDTVLNGKNPTHIFSYGGFRLTLQPRYSGSYENLNGAYGKMWLERGGIFVLANIRGGAEYGPSWHEAALLQNRFRAFEDFEAVAEDLIQRRITSARHIGIEGRSNGGLLVGATMVRRPELFGAVVCGVPLLDLYRYPKLLAGASWMAEFGNPDVPEHWAFLSQYAPYQNVSKDKKYPPVFFYTSTKDDRVHPGHARKMMARMEAQGHKVYYYENTEGGHSGSSTNAQLAHRLALSYTHLWRNLK